MATKRNQSKVKGSSSFVLMIGDEGAILVQLQKKRVLRRIFAPSPEPANIRTFEDLLDSAPRAPLRIVVDMMDQSYVRQTLPPVSSFSLGKIIRRRLDKDFSRDDIKGHLILHREESGRRDWNYLMVSLANPALLQKWISFAVERSNPFKGIGLVPLESQDFINTLARSFLKDKKAEPLEWQILVSHHKVGGFRQVVLKKGKLVFTRLAQPIGESNPEVIAGNIEQEMINTQEYLKRLGLQDPSTLAVTILASFEIQQVMDPKNIKAGEYHFFTPNEMAARLSLEGAALPEDHFGDVVISAFIGQKRKLMLPLFTPYTDKLRRFGQYNIMLRAAATCAALGLIAWIGMSGWDILAAKSQTENLVTQQKSIRSQLESVKRQEKLLPKQMAAYTDIITLVKNLDKRGFDALVFVNTFASALQDAALVKTYHWGVSDPLAVDKEGSKLQVTGEMDIVLAANPSHDQFIASAVALMDRFKKAFPDYDVTHSELPGLLSDTKELKTVLDDSGNTPQSAEAHSETDTVKITIKGPVEQAGKNGH